MLEINIKKLYDAGKLNKPLVIWGIGRETGALIEILRKYPDLHILAIVDNFKNNFYNEYCGVKVFAPEAFVECYAKDFCILLNTKWAEAITRQIEALVSREVLLEGTVKVYNLLYENAQITDFTQITIPYQFENRQQGKENLCYVLAGYDPKLWDSTLARIEVFQSERYDYCIVSSGKYDEVLAEMAKKNGWSYLATERNQVAYIQNLVIELHPHAKYILKMDEDIFIGKDFFDRMINTYRECEAEGESRIGFLVPIIPLNVAGVVSYLKAIGRKEEFEKRFGRVYRSRFSQVFDFEETAVWLWDTMDCFDEMAEQIGNRSGVEVCDCYYNIGCILYSRSRWSLMGKWPVLSEEGGMGADEEYIYRDNKDKDLVIYEAQGILAGHLAFGMQKKRMMEYYFEHKDKFLPRRIPQCR